MKKLIVLIVLCLSIQPSFGQMVADHSFASSSGQFTTVTLSRSGKKIVISSNPYSSLSQPDTIWFYNLDYSLWKQIPVPFIPGYRHEVSFMDKDGYTPGIFYPSETLFNTDTLLEAGIYYADATNSNNKLYIENENGVFTDSILHVVSSSEFRVFEGAGGVFYANISTQTGIEIYKLPGTLPCTNCCGRDTIVIHDKVVSLSHHAGKPGIPTQPLPNPSKDEVKITFTLPNGVSRGELLLYTSSGQLLKSYQVDNRFGFIMLDNTLLAPGLYYYNIVANGQVSSTQKLLVVK